MENATPMLRQYLELKKDHPGTLLFFRLGDFYELFNEDAIVGSREMGITLTARQKSSENPIPMCGVPHHAAANYIAKLIKKGYRVAICEQTEPVQKGVKLVKRDVVRIITPGTAIDPQLLDAKQPTFVAAVSVSGDKAGAALLEVSTGEMLATQTEGDNALKEIFDIVEAYSAREIIFAESLDPLIKREFAKNPDVKKIDGPLYKQSDPIITNGGSILTALSDEDFAFDRGSNLLTDHFKIKSLDVFALKDKNEAIKAAAACLGYALTTQRSAIEHISSIEYFETTSCLVLDSLTSKNLELFDSFGESSKNTLFKTIDECITGMGSRLLRSWLQRPSVKRTEIQTRQAAVTELCDSILRDQIRFLLKEVSDMERLIGRLNLGSITARDLQSLSASLAQTPKVVSLLSDANSMLLQVLCENMFDLEELVELIDSAINDDPPTNISDGGTIREGFNAELDELRGISRSAKQTIATFEDAERERTGIQSLKIKFNNVFGYFIEVSKGNLSKVPDDYIRRQTLTNAERFTTPDLKEWEDKVLGAEDRILQIEQRLFAEIKAAIKAETRKLQSTARALALLDALCGLAETAVSFNYVAPVMHDGDEIEIRMGRHPVVERVLKDDFIPNDLYLNNSTDRLLIITGANMGGKSTILRQVALIQILAQIGSFVPAEFARLPLIDKIWTRVGASDDLASGRSTFMVEMTETASILHNATPKSLILLDEIGRGTSTFDGISIAWSVAEYLHNSPKHSGKTLFATHYHELTELADSLPGAQNYQIAATETDNEVVFLHKLKKGKASKSYGIAVARLAGLPVEVIKRAEDVLHKLEKYELAVFNDGQNTGLEKAARSAASVQSSLFAISNESVIDEIRNANTDTLNDGEAKEMIERLKQQII